MFTLKNILGGMAAKKDGKMRIRAFPMTMDEKYVENIWNLLKEAIQVFITFVSIFREANCFIAHRKFKRRTTLGCHLRSCIEMPTQWFCTSTERGSTAD